MSDKIEVKNAIIESVRLGKERGTFIVGWIYLDYGGSSQGFGGHVLYIDGKRNNTDYTGHFIWRVLDTVGVDEWAGLVGKSVRVKSDWGKVHAIGHFIKDKWFNVADEFEALEDD